MGDSRIHPCHVVIAADQLSEEHVRRLAAILDGWATWERLPQDAPATAFAEALQRADVLVGWARPDLLARSPVKTYLCGSAGMDGYLGHGLESKPGFQICNAGRTMAAPIAEHVLAMMFALARRLPEIVRNQARRRWERQWTAGELAGSTVCIAGLGGSGSEFARRCRALGMKVVGVRRDASRGHPDAERVFSPAQLKEAVASADHVVALTPGGPGTRHLFNGGVFGAMKPGACYYTASRGSVTDEQALIAHLRSGRLDGAGLDVFASEPLPPDSPLWTMDNVIVSPHSAGLSDRLSGRLCDLMCENLTRLRRGEPLANTVDLAALAAPPR